MKEKTRSLLNHAEYYSLIIAILSSFIAGLVLSSFNYLLLGGLVLILCAIKPVVKLQKISRIFNEKVVERSQKNTVKIYDDALLDVAQMDNPNCLSTEQLENDLIRDNRKAMALVVLSTLCLFGGTVWKDFEYKKDLQRVSTQIQNKLNEKDSVVNLRIINLDESLDSLLLSVENTNENIIQLQEYLKKMSIRQ